MRSLLTLATFLSGLNARLVYPDSDGEYRIKVDLPGNHFNFSVLGDWGGFPRPFLNTPIQLSAAELLGQVSERDGSQFNLAIGDNFYFWGVDDVFDDRFATTFERVYTAKALQKPWYVLLGNHDWQGNATAQVAYSRYSNRWTLPKFWYSVEYRLVEPGVTVKFLMFDSQIHVDQGDQKATNRQYPTMPTPEQKAAQWEWLQKELKSSADVDYLFFVSHYDTNTPWSHITAMEDVEQILMEHKVSAHIYGHKHDSWHMTSKVSSDSNYKLHYLCSGIGALMDPQAREATNPYVDVHFMFNHLRGFKGGFMMGKVTGSETTFDFYYAGSESGHQKDEAQYSAIIPRRT